MSDASLTTRNTYIAWSVYTGPRGAQPLWKNSRWITGNWNGNPISSPDDVKKDIDARIALLIKAFETARSSLSNRQKQFAINYFVVPEFYFHCSFGPYPYVSVSGLLPYEYIVASLRERLESIQLLDNEQWLICTGSALTCNVEDIPEFLSSAEIADRLATLNEHIKGLPPAEGAQLLEHDGHVKAFGYFAEFTVGDSPQKDIGQLMIEYRSNPLCTVRNRGAMIKITRRGSEVLTFEKQNESTVDLTMGALNDDRNGKSISIGGMIPEWSANYPSISIINGDKNAQSNPFAARMTFDDAQSSQSLQIGVEICLDHRLKRLRRTVGMTVANGAAADNPMLDLQLIPSGGMQILEQSVAAGVRGTMFNSDGSDPILDQYKSSGKPVIKCSGTYKGLAGGTYVSCAQSMVNSNGQNYFSHSQLAFRHGDDVVSGYNNALGTSNKIAATYDTESGKNRLLDDYLPPRILAVTDVGSYHLYAAGTGELHEYIHKSND